MVTSFYVKAKAKELLNIATTDSAEDTELDTLGAIADKHIDNILKQHDERIPLVAGNVTNELVGAASYYVAYIFRGKRGDEAASKFWKAAFDTVIAGIIEDLSIEGLSYDVQRFNDRYREEDVYRNW